MVAQKPKLSKAFELVKNNDFEKNFLLKIKMSTNLILDNRFHIDWQKIVSRRIHTKASSV